MKQIDKDGLLLCDFQGNIFSDSLMKTGCSTEIFIRRFMLSDVAVLFDSLAILDDPISENDVFLEIEKEFGKSNYGKIRYDKEVLFWIGYLYRYFAYTYNLISKQIYRILKAKELNESYFSYHTMDLKIAIERILEEKNLSFDLEAQNRRLLQMLREQRYEQGILLENPILNPKKGNLYLFQDDLDSSMDNMKFTFLSDSEEYSIMKEILYHEERIGEIRFQKEKDQQYRFEILIFDEYHQNKGIGTAVLKKAIEFAKHGKMSSLYVEIPKQDERNIHLFKKAGFSYAKENDAFVCLEIFL